MSPTIVIKRFNNKSYYYLTQLTTHYIGSVEDTPLSKLKKICIDNNIPYAKTIKRLQSK